MGSAAVSRWAYTWTDVQQVLGYKNTHVIKFNTLAMNNYITCEVNCNYPGQCYNETYISHFQTLSQSLHNFNMYVCY